MRDDDDYSNDGMLSDNVRRGRKSNKTIIPNFKSFRRRGKRRTNSSDAGNLMLGIFTIFPVITYLTMTFPKEVFFLVGFIFIGAWVFSEFKSGLYFLWWFTVSVLLGFVCIFVIFFIMAMLGF